LILTVKRLILRTLADLGYVVLKRPDYERLLAATVPAMTAGDLTARVSPMTPGDSSPPVPSVTGGYASVETAPPAPGDGGQASPLEPDFQRFYDALDDQSSLPLMHVHAVYCALRYLTKAKIPGDVVECGNGSGEALAIAGAALVALGDTSRALILFDVSGDPTHRAETELVLWGGPGRLLSSGERPVERRSRKPGWLPPELLVSGYPRERIRIVYAPTKALDASWPVAFLGLTAESYPANRAAIRSLVPRVSIGGIIAVDANPWIRSPHDAVWFPQDAVTEILDEQGIPVLLQRVTSTYRIGVRACIQS
jgi:O-methyltransferase